MSKLKRYGFGLNFGLRGDGEYCYYADVAALEAENQRQAKALIQIGHGIECTIEDARKIARAALEPQ